MPADLPATRSAAEAFRKKYISGQVFDGKYPIDTVYIADRLLRIDLVQFPQLEDLIGASAYLTANLKEMYVDEDLLCAYEVPQAPLWKKDRLRFSVAHELGHVAMHAELLPRFRCNTIEELIGRFNTDTPERDGIEKEANEFAGRLIVPADKLKEALDGYTSAQGPRWRDNAALRASFAEQCSRHFGLNSEGVRVRLEREGLWPAAWTSGG